MRLLITLDFPPAIGGIQTYLYGIVRFTYHEQDHVFVAGIKPHSHTPPAMTPHVRYFSSLFNGLNRKIALVLCVFPYLRLCRRYHGMLSVACGNIYAAVIPWLFSGILRQPYAIYTYGTELIGLHRPSVKNSLLKKVLFGAQKLYTLGTYSETILRKLSVTCPVEIVPPRIILPPGKTTRETGRRACCSILTIGRLVKHKGYENLIRAMARMVQEGDYTLVIVGNGPHYHSLCTLSKALHLEERVSIKRHCTDALLENEFAAADIFVLPSQEISEGTEGFGIVLLEAMAHNIPIVASATGGIPEVLDNGTCGMLVKPDDVDALVNAVRKITEDRSFADTLVRRAHERLMAHYVWQ